MKLHSLIATLTIMALATTSCGTLRDQMSKISSSKSPAKTETKAPVAVADSAATATPSTQSLSDLEGEWSITEVLGKEVVVNGENHPKLTLTPDTSGMLEVIGYNGCNYLNGKWNIRDNHIIPAGELISSLRACPDAPYEFMVNQALGQAENYKITEPSVMVFYSASGSPVMTLRKRGLAFLNGSWRVTAIDGTPVKANIYIVLDIDERKVHGNAGCNLLNGEIVVNLDKGDGIEFRNLVTTRMTCPDIAAERQFLLALENVDTATKGTDDDTAILKDSSSKEVISLVRLTPEQLKELSNE